MAYFPNLCICVVLGVFSKCFAFTRVGSYDRRLLQRRDAMWGNTKPQPTTPKPQPTPLSRPISSGNVDKDGIPINGIIDYIGNTTTESGDRWQFLDSIPKPMEFKPLDAVTTLRNSLKFLCQWPWKKIGVGKVVLRSKIGGDLPLEKTTKSGLSALSSGKSDPFFVESLEELQKMFLLGAIDQRVVAIFLEIGPVNGGYAKLTELRRSMQYFASSGKKIYAYFSAGSEKEMFIAAGCTEVYVPPDGIIDLRGFAGGAQFFGGIFKKLGVEPQVQRIGKYKSFGDSYNRTSIAEAQREVVSSLLMETSDFWAHTVAQSLKKSTSDVLSLWGQNAGSKSPFVYKDLGYVTGVNYIDAVEVKILEDVQPLASISPLESTLFLLRGLNWQEEIAKRGHVSQLYEADSNQNVKPKSSIVERFSNITRSINSANWSDFSLTETFQDQPRRSLDTVVDITENPKKSGTSFKFRNGTSSIKKRARFLPAGLYLRKMSNLQLRGVPLKEVRSGARVAVINAVGGIGPGPSSDRPGSGKSIGADTLIEQLRKVRDDPEIKGLVLRIDSPGGSALASDLIWKEVRACSKLKPVIASQVDVAASGGYYLSMACDAIFAEETTITGSIGVVAAKFNIGELTEKVGLATEIISRGKFAELLSSTRGFTQSEEEYFEESARIAYLSFITKAAASRNMSVESMDVVAQGRVWTGKQAMERNLVDRSGGLWHAVAEVHRLAGLNTTIDGKMGGMRVQTIRPESRGLGIPFIGGRASSLDSKSLEPFNRFGDSLLLVDDDVAALNMVSPESLGIPPVFRGTGIGPLVAHTLVSSRVLDQLLEAVSSVLIK